MVSQITPHLSKLFILIGLPIVAGICTEGVLVNKSVTQLCLRVIGFKMKFDTYFFFLYTLLHYQKSN